MPPSDAAARLQQLAGEVALQLVGQALAQLLPGPRASDVVVTVHVPKALPPVPRVKRKYTRRAPTAKRAPKPQTSVPGKGAGWSAARRRKFLATIAAKRQQVKKSAPPIPAGACKRCAHGRNTHHDGDGCVVPRCVCQAFCE